jgi:carbon storage regulator (csrA)
MLVLARRRGDSIVIGDDIEITVVEVQGDNVKIGITAPKTIMVLRKELMEEAGFANTQAASTDIDLNALEKLYGSKGKARMQ